jgi:hypothetical protein
LRIALDLQNGNRVFNRDHSTVTDLAKLRG